jgi:hypothetical protein
MCPRWRLAVTSRRGLRAPTRSSRRANHGGLGWSQRRRAARPPVHHADRTRGQFIVVAPDSDRVRIWGVSSTGAPAAASSFASSAYTGCGRSASFHDHAWRALHEIRTRQADEEREAGADHDDVRGADGRHPGHQIAPARVRGPGSSARRPRPPRWRKRPRPQAMQTPAELLADAAQLGRPAR